MTDNSNHMKSAGTDGSPAAAGDRKFDRSFRKAYLHPRYLPVWILLGILGILSFIPPVIRDFMANLLYRPLMSLPFKQKKIVYTNLKLCFPEKSAEEIEVITRDFFRVGLKVTLGYGESFFRSRKYLRKTYMVTGEEYLKEALALGKPIIFMAPHAWAIDHAGLYLSASGLTMCTMMHTSKNPVYDWFMNSMRLKFDGKVYERGAGIKSIVRALRDGYHSFFLPDQDLGEANSVFVKFFAQDKCTLMVLPRLAKMADAAVVPMFSCYNEEQHRYEVVFDRYFEGYPTGDIMADVRRMNAVIEKLIQGREKQYMWFLRYFKTRKDGIGVY